MSIRTNTLLSLTLFFFSGGMFCHHSSFEAHADTTIDSMLAVVGQRIITQSDILVEAIVSGTTQSRLPWLELRRKQTPLDFLVDIEIMNLLAKGVPLYNPSTEAIEQQFAKSKHLIVQHPTLLDEERLRTLIQNLITAENFLQSNLGRDTIQSNNYHRYLKWVQNLRDRVPNRKVESE